MPTAPLPVSDVATFMVVLAEAEALVSERLSRVPVVIELEDSVNAVPLVSEFQVIVSLLFVLSREWVAAAAEMPDRALLATPPVALHDRTPEPLVVRTLVLAPALPGNVAVHDPA